MEVKLVMFKQDGQRRDFQLKKDTATIGRNTDCDFQIPLGVISRRQCQLSIKGEKLFVRDLGSSNGTFVNNKRVQESELKAGDTLVLGPVIFTIVINGDPAEVKPVRTIVDSKKARAAVEAPTRDEGTVDVDAGVDEVEEVEEVEEEQMGANDESAVEVEVEEDEEEEAGAGDDPLSALEAISKKKKP
jgi:pSer/pThr/pTyr-binding forkhead associated (FHA) protein